MTSIRLIIMLAAALCTSSVHGTDDTQDTPKMPPAQSSLEQTPLTKIVHGASPLPCAFFRPVGYTSTSVQTFIEKAFNHPAYPQEYLALNFSHVQDLLSVAHKNPYPRTFIKRALNLFVIKLHGIAINPYAFGTMLSQLQIHCAPFMTYDTEEQDILERMKEALGSWLLNDFDHLRTRPSEAIERVCKELHGLMHDAQDFDCSLRELQHTIYFFIAQGLHLLVWSPDDQQDAWDNLCELAEHLRNCEEAHLIDADMLDTCYWLLVHRFSHFLHCAGKELSPAFFQAAQTGMTTGGDAAFWNTKEREQLITTKATYLRDALIRAELSSQLRAEGYAL